MTIRPDSDSDIMSNLWDEDGDDDKSSATSVGSGSDIVIHNTTSDEGDDFDIIADYVFQNSDAESVLIHHRDIALLRESGGSMDISSLLFEKRPSVIVDESGVGTIRPRTDSSVQGQSNRSLGVTSPTLSPIPKEIEEKPTKGVGLPEPITGWGYEVAAEFSLDDAGGGSTRPNEQVTMIDPDRLPLPSSPNEAALQVPDEVVTKH